MKFSTTVTLSLVYLFKMAAVGHLGLVVHVSGTPTKSICISTVQNLVGIDVVVSVICKFEYFMSLAEKCLLVPINKFFEGASGRFYVRSCEIDAALKIRFFPRDAAMLARSWEL